MKIFIDTGAFIAYFIKQESFHEEVVKRYTFYRQQNAIFLTSNYVLDELLTWFGSHQTKALTEKLIGGLQFMIEEKQLGVLYIDSVIAKKAQEVLLKFFEHKISFTDATTYILYKDFKVDEIFTLDSDFRKMRATISPNID